MSSLISNFGSIPSSVGGTFALPMGSLIQGATPFKNKRIYDMNKGSIQTEALDQYTLNSFNFYSKEIFLPKKNKSN